MITSQQLIRAFHTTLPRLVRNRRANPGAAHQLKELDHEMLAEDPEGFGDIESDFMTVHRTRREHEAAMEQQRERVRFQMIKHKYFRDNKLPNLLTYAEKEQMRLLHSRDPEEWTPERLAESFPATRDIIEKILKAKWRPATQARLRKHDEAVMRNWEQVRNGELASQLTPELREHLQKFVLRKREDFQPNLETRVKQEELLRPALPRPQHQEFVSLITTCSKYAEPSVSTLSLRAGKKPNALPIAPTTADKENETYLLDKVQDKRRMRLEDVKQLKLLPAEQAKVQNYSLEQRAVQSFGSPSGTGIVPTIVEKNNHNNNNSLQLEKSNYIEKFQSNEIIISAEDQRRYEMSSVKDRIHIPRKLWRQGATFRVEDCYYDDDGEFLYRVPGMTGK